MEDDSAIMRRPSINTRTGLLLGGGGDHMLASGNSNDLESAAWSMGQSGSMLSTPISSLPFPPDVIPRPLTTREAQLVDHLVRLQLFLATAPSSWQQHGTVPSGPMYPGVGDWANFASGEPTSFISSPHPALNRFLLPNGEHVSCVYWNGLYQITGTDIVRALAFRFEAFGRPVKTTMVKKFEEGVFSDLRNLKPGEDSSLEKPKSEFLDMLFKYGCIRTQKKQKVFFWFSVPHDRLFLDALERDLKREKDGQAPTTEIVGEPARSFRWDPALSLYEQFAAPDIERQLATAETQADDPNSNSNHFASEASARDLGESLIPSPNTKLHIAQEPLPQLPLPSGIDRRREPFSVTLFEGSPGYKQRKRKGNKEKKRQSIAGGENSDMEDESGSEADMVSTEAYPSRHPPAMYQQPPSQRYSSYPAISSYPERYSTGQYQPAVNYPNQSDGDAHSSPYNVPMPRSLSHSYGGSPPRPPSQPNYPTQQPPPQWSAQQLFPQSAAYGLVNAYTQPAPAPGPSQRPAPFPPPMQQINAAASSSDNEVEPSERAASDGESSSDISSRMFRCPLDTCSRLFKRLEHLKRHVRTHTQERPYLCSKCSKRFSRSDNLTQHLKTHDKNDPKQEIFGQAGGGGVMHMMQGQAGGGGMGQQQGHSYSGRMSSVAPYSGAGVQRINRGPNRQNSFDPVPQRSVSRTDSHLGIPAHMGQQNQIQRMGTASPQPIDYMGSPSHSPFAGRLSLGANQGDRYNPYAHNAGDPMNGVRASSRAGSSTSMQGSPYAMQSLPMDPVLYNGGFDPSMTSVNPTALNDNGAMSQAYEALPLQVQPNAREAAGNGTVDLSTTEPDMRIPLQTPAGGTFEGMLVTAAMTDGGGPGWPGREGSRSAEE